MQRYCISFRWKKLNETHSLVLGQFFIFFVKNISVFCFPQEMFDTHSLVGNASPPVKGFFELFRYINMVQTKCVFFILWKSLPPIRSLFLMGRKKIQPRKENTHF